MHFGIYSVLGKGEWAKHLHQIPEEEYYSLMEQFDPKPDWVKELVTIAKEVGCKYITLTTRHHDGFSLYDTCGLNTLDALSIYVTVWRFCVPMEGSPKYVASEMCEIFGNHWAYAKKDLDFKSPARMIEELAECRKYGANMLLNIGPMGDGSFRPIDAVILGIVGEWVGYFDEAIRCPRPTGISIENKPDDFLLKEGNKYYLFCFHLPRTANSNVDRFEDADYRDCFHLEEKIESVVWMDNGSEVPFTQENNKVTVYTEAYGYGSNLVVRVARITCSIK